MGLGDLEGYLSAGSPADQNKVAGLWDDACKGFLIKPPRGTVFFVSLDFQGALIRNDFAKIHPERFTLLGLGSWNSGSKRIPKNVALSAAMSEDGSSES